MNFNDCKNEIWETVSNLPKTEILERIPSIPELCKLGWTPSSLIQEIKKHPIISFKSRDDIASEEDFGRVEFVSRDGCNLKGWSYKKQCQSNDAGTAFVLHGFLQNSQEFKNIAMRISEQHNVSVISFDHRMHGWSDMKMPSFGTYESYDIQAAMDYADEHNYPKPYILLGASLGAMTAQRAGFVDKRVKGLFLVSPPANSWQAINTNKKFGGDAGKVVDYYYGWNVLDDGDILRHTQPSSHTPYICCYMGKDDEYGIDKTEESFNHWHNGEGGEYNKFPSEVPNAKKIFWQLEGLGHMDAWKWENAWRLEDEFFKKVLNDYKVEEVGIKACNGKFVMASMTNPEDNGKAGAWADNIGPWETFELIKNGDGTVSFKNQNNNNFLCVDSHHGDFLWASRDDFDTWEKFTIEEYGDKVALKTHNGRYVSVDLSENGDSFLRADWAWEVQEWELFELIKL